ncbi:MAG: gliding motility-associated-like protein [Sphingobacteriales bacterium]|jgi:gliding motility-associated-like protein
MKIIIISVFLFLTSSERYLHAQTFSQSVIGSTGFVGTSPNGSMAWTVGESLILTDSSSSFSSGFHQPYSVIESKMRGFVLPEGFSPNGDEINDLFVIEGIQNHPNNSIVVFNRWGNKVFFANPYNNSWDGKSAFGIRIGGDDLPIGTYFYILDLGDNTAAIKGTIYLNR